MKKKLQFAAAILLCSYSTMYAQDDVLTSDSRGNGFKLNHTIGVQVNELVRQVFNFNDVSARNTNPFLFIYHVNHNPTGWGVRLGVGPYFKTFQDDDGIVETESDVNIFDARVGIEKAFRLSPKWSAGAGADFVYHRDLTITKTFTKTFDSTRTDLNSNITTIGYGAMGWLRYHITPNVLIGTETSFYYRSGDNKQQISITTKQSGFPGPGTTQTKKSEIDNGVKEGIFYVPTAIYLMVRF